MSPEPYPSNAPEESVLAFLAEAVDEFVSGEAMSDKLGLSRAAIWKQVNKLRENGYQIDALPARGYRLVAAPDRLTPLELRPLINTHEIGQSLHCYDEVTSTSDLCRQLGEEGGAHGEVVLAEVQTSGRGRRGRNWSSASHTNLLFSVLLRPDLPAQRAPELTLVGAVALCEVFRQMGVQAVLKWPNDILVDGRKIAGLLAELVSDGTSGVLDFVVLGVGCNLNARTEDFPPELRETATSLLLERGQRAPRALFATACFARLEHWLLVHAQQGFAPVLEAWRKFSETLGQEVVVEMEGRQIQGKAEDVDSTGALLIRMGDRLETIHSGEIRSLRSR